MACLLLGWGKGPRGRCEAKGLEGGHLLALAFSGPGLAVVPVPAQEVAGSGV